MINAKLNIFLICGNFEEKRGGGKYGNFNLGFFTKLLKNLKKSKILDDVIHQTFFAVSKINGANIDGI